MYIRYLIWNRKDINLTLPQVQTFVQWAKALVGGPGAEPLSGDFSAARRGTIKCNFTATPQAGKDRFLCLFQIKWYEDILTDDCTILLRHWLMMTRVLTWRYYRVLQAPELLFEGICS